MKNILKLLVTFFVISLMAVSCSKVRFQLVNPNESTLPTQTTSTENQDSAPEALIVPPTSRAKERITKKPFGIYITPKTSPVQPEKFSGYHTGTDFEAFPEEANTDVPVMAICEGKLLQKRTATGYGGLVVQACDVDGESITVVYGHVRLSSVTAKVGDVLKRGGQIAMLGKGYSSETSGERKHLHLGIHKGTSVVILGYVKNQSALSSWLDIKPFLE